MSEETFGNDNRGGLGLKGKKEKLGKQAETATSGVMTLAALFLPAILACVMFLQHDVRLQITDQKVARFDSVQDAAQYAVNATLLEFVLITFGVLALSLITGKMPTYIMGAFTVIGVWINLYINGLYDHRYQSAIEQIDTAQPAEDVYGQMSILLETKILGYLLLTTHCLAIGGFFLLKYLRSAKA